MIAGDDNYDKPCIFSKKYKDRKYVIPVYQRPYSWDENNIDDFLQTIMDGFNNSCEMKFFGTMQFNVGKENETLEFQIVDGQQRMTTMILFVHTLDLLSGRNSVLEYGLNLYNKNVNTADQELKNVLDSDEIGNISLGNKGKADISKVKNKYEANIRLLNRKFVEYYKDSDQSKYKTIKGFANSVLDYFLSGLYVVVLETERNRLRLPEIVNIFNTINTTGMALDDSDIFKLQYFDYLNQKSQDSDDICMEKIKSCYDVIEQYNSNKFNKDKIGISWILDIYKHCICAKYNLKFDELSKSNERFFDDLFKNPTDYGEILEFESFRKIVVSFVDFWTRLQNDSLGNNVFQALSVQLIESSRYSRYWTIPFVYAYFNLPDNWESLDNKSVYNSALENSFAVARFFIVNSVNFAKVINPVQSIVCNDILPMISERKSVVNYIDTIIWDSPYSNDEKGIETAKKWFISWIEKNSFSNSKVGLMCLLLAIKAEMDHKNNLTYIKDILFNWDEHPYDIEHICSRAIFENDQLKSDEEKARFNGLGNLVVLEREINREMGRKMILEAAKKDNPQYYQRTQYAVAQAVIPKLNTWDIKTVENRCRELEIIIIDILSNN